MYENDVHEKKENVFPHSSEILTSKTISVKELCSQAPADISGCFCHG